MVGSCLAQTLSTGRTDEKSIYGNSTNTAKIELHDGEYVTEVQFSGMD